MFKTALSIALLSALGLTLSATATAATFTIAQRDSDGLVAAIRAANATVEADVIQLAAGGIYPLLKASEAEQGLGLPKIRSDITIVGNGAEIRRYADESFALFAVTPAGSLTLKQLTLAEGSGTIVNDGRLTLDGVKIVDHSVRGTVAILENHGRLIAVDSDVSYNAITNAKRDAGVVLNHGSIELVNTRIEANRVTGNSPTVATASALLNLGKANLRQVAIRDNTAGPELENGQNMGHTLVNMLGGEMVANGIELTNNWPTTANNLPGTGVRSAP